MKIDLRGLLAEGAGIVRFSCEADLSDLDFFGVRPFQSGAEVKGEVVKSAGGLLLEFAIDAALDALCASCGRSVKVRFYHKESAYLGEGGEDNEHIAIEGGELDIEPVVRDAVVLNMETRILCGEDCKGVCPKCGANLNDGPCTCPRGIDPRFEKLRGLL